MKSRFLLFASIFFCHFVIAQIQNGPTRYDAFINNSKIQWAGLFPAYIKPGCGDVKNYLLDQFIKGTLKAYKPVQYRWPDALELTPVDKAQIKAIHNIDVSQEANRKDANLSADEIFYIQKDKLYSYIPWVSVRYPIVTPAGNFLGEARIFTTAVNTKSRKKDFRKKDFLCRSFQYFNLDSLTADNKLKELYGQGLIGTLWPVWLKSEKVFFAKDSSRALVNTEGNGFKSSIVINVPVYNINGELTGNKSLSPYYKQEDFKKIAIEQDWYYCKKKNRFFTKVISIYLCAADEMIFKNNSVLLKDGYHAILKMKL